MNLEKAIENVATVLELKRIASAYVIDYKNLSEDEIKAAMVKTAPQYYFEENVKKALNSLFLSGSRNHRVLSRIIIADILLHKDNFMCPKRQTEDDTIALEQAIINRANEDLFQKGSERSKWIDLFQFVVETAWEYNDDISSDEKNLIEKLRHKLKITHDEYRIIEAKFGKFPKSGNELHTRGEIEEVRRLMQSNGFLFSIRDTDNTNFDVIPEEVAHSIRNILGIEIRRHGYRDLLSHKYVRSKKYTLRTLKKSKIAVEANTTLKSLQETVLEQVPPSILLGGISPRDGLDFSDLRNWVSELNLNVSGLKGELIARIIGYYDNILEKGETAGDDREIWYVHYEAFAARDLRFLRDQQLIQKDLECETKFEGATNFLFEKMLFHTPLKLVGTAHADGALSYQDKVILWDNKSKETPVNLKDHIRQFDSYIKGSERTVAGFLVIGPDFTKESSSLAMQYKVKNDTTISLITANELKDIAKQWCANKADKQEDPFPLGYLIQPGRIDKTLIPF